MTISPTPWSIDWSGTGDPDKYTEYSSHRDPVIVDANGEFVCMMSYDTLSYSVRDEIVENAEAIVREINERYA